MPLLINMHVKEVGQRLTRRIYFFLVHDGVAAVGWHECALTIGSPASLLPFAQPPLPCDAVEVGWIAEAIALSILLKTGKLISK